MHNMCGIILLYGWYKSTCMSGIISIYMWGIILDICPVGPHMCPMCFHMCVLGGISGHRLNQPSPLTLREISCMAAWSTRSWVIISKPGNEEYHLGGSSSSHRGPMPLSCVWRVLLQSQGSHAGRHACLINMFYFACFIAFNLIN